MDESMEASHPTFADQVRSTNAQPIDLELARINADVYEPLGTRVGRWYPAPAAELAGANIRPSDLENSHAGFRARVYTDGEGHYVLAFCGTNQARDWKHNFRQGVGLEDAQYDRAIDLSRTARLAFGDNLVLTGHSLGGGLASVGALATGAPAVTFNSAGLHDNSMQRLDFSPEETRRAIASNGLIRRYTVDHEILTTLQEENLLTRGLLPDAIGHRIELPDPEPLHGWRRLIPGSGLKHGLEMHGRDSVLRAEELAQHSMAEPAHPAHTMYQAALDGMHGLRPEALGYANEDQYRNAAGSLVASAREAGLKRIDHVVVGANGALFAVEGPLQDASHRIASVDGQQAAARSFEESSLAASAASTLQAAERIGSIAQPLPSDRRSVLTP